jgi:hypothetical protein
MQVLIIGAGLAATAVPAIARILLEREVLGDLWPADESARAPVGAPWPGSRCFSVLRCLARAVGGTLVNRATGMMWQQASA